MAVGRCLSYGEGLTFWPLREVVAALAGDRRRRERRRGRRPGSRACCRTTTTRRPIVERVAGALGWSETAADPPETFWAVRKLLAAAAAERPLVIVLRGHPLGRARPSST